MRTRWLTFALLFVACGDATVSPPASMDASVTNPRNDRININCTGPGGLAESAEDCARRLATAIPGARFFVGPRRACDASLFSAACAPLCALSAINPEDCMFDSARNGCPYDSADGYTVVVEVSGRRGVAAVGAGDTCGGVPGVRGTAVWGRVSIDDLRTAAMSATAPPRDAGVPMTDGGASDRPTATDIPSTVDRFNRCTAEGDACGPIVGDNCTRLMSGALLCTRGCATDDDCAGGTCRTFCYKRCGGMNPPCPMGFQCNMQGAATTGACLPNPA